MKNKSGWEQLLCDYFFTVCLRILGPYFSSLGFIEEKSNINGVIFKKNDLFVEVSYLPEFAPNYCPSLVVGIGDSKYDDAGKPAVVPAWSILSENDQARNYSFWKFSNAEELETVLNKLKTEIIERHMKPLWDDREKLENAIKIFS